MDRGFIILHKDLGAFMWIQYKGHVHCGCPVIDTFHSFKQDIKTYKTIERGCGASEG